MQNDDLRSNNYKQFLVKNESGAARKKIIIDFFFELKYFFVFSFKFLNIVCPDQIQKSYIFYKKNCKV